MNDFKLECNKCGKEFQYPPFNKDDKTTYCECGNLVVSKSGKTMFHCKKIKES